MAHNISALIAKAPVDMDVAQEFDLPVFVQNGFAIVALYPEHCDHWAEKLGLPHEGRSDILLDCPVTHAFAKRLGLENYALIETNYFGGIGEQWAAVYRAGEVRMAPTKGGINAALEMLGVKREAGLDEFDTIGLGHHRSFDTLFEKYWH
jgi:hypothetical protein